MYIQLLKRKCIYQNMSLSDKEWNVLYYIWHHKLERPLFYKLSEVKHGGMREYNKSLFVSKLNISPYLLAFVEASNPHISVYKNTPYFCAT